MVFFTVIWPFSFPLASAKSDSDILQQYSSEHILFPHHQVRLFSSRNFQVNSKKLFQLRLWNPRELQISESAWLSTAIL